MLRSEEGYLAEVHADGDGFLLDRAPLSDPRGRGRRAAHCAAPSSTCSDGCSGPVSRSPERSTCSPATAGARTGCEAADRLTTNAHGNVPGMADFLLGGQIDPATHQRTDPLTTIAVGRSHHPRRDRRHDRLGQDRARGRAHRGGAERRRADAADRPEGRPHQPVPHVPRARRRRLRTVGQRGRRAEGRPVRARLRRRAGQGVDRRPRRLGHHAGSHRRAARQASSSRSTRRARTPASGSTSSARCRRRPTSATPRSSATRSRASSAGC